MAVPSRSTVVPILPPYPSSSLFRCWKNRSRIQRRQFRRLGRFRSTIAAEFLRFLFPFSFLFFGVLLPSIDGRASVVYEIAAVFPKSGNFTDYEQSFMGAIGRLNNDGGERGPGDDDVSFDGVALAGIGSPGDLLLYACDAIQNRNIRVLIAIGDQNAINALSIATKFNGIPLIGYNVQRRAVMIRGERLYYLQLEPGKTLMAKALVQILHANNWHYASLIIEDSSPYTADGFVDAFYRFTSGTNSSLWSVEDYIRIHRNATKDEIDYQLLLLLENQSRVIILHCSPKLARLIFEVAGANDFVHGYAWFVTDDVIRNDRVLDGYPVGLVAVNASHVLSPKDLIPDAVRLIGAAVRVYHDAVTAEEEKEVASSEGPPAVVAVTQRTSSPDQRQTQSPNRNCWNPLSSHAHEGAQLYRILKNTSVETSYGRLSFDEEGVRNSVHELQILNLVLGDDGLKRWNVIGNLRNETIRYSTIVWPGNTVSGPTDHGRRTLRVVTVVVEPFVMEQPGMGYCVTSVPCLRIGRVNKTRLDDIFKDFAARNSKNASLSSDLQYSVSCCQGLSVMLLEKLARDLNFAIQLYITPDDLFGSMTEGGDRDGRTGGDGEETAWNGMVDDLNRGMAHMAISAFSVTKSRSRVIDFTYPYFYSAFAILVSEKKRSPPIHAFMEPFDGWVWLSIVCSATVVAVALSLLEWNSPFGLNPWGRKRKTNYTLGSGLNMVYAILFQHTIKTKSPKAWPSKWLQNFWAGASIFIYSSYTANLAAFLAGKNSRVVISGLDDPRLMEPGTKIGLLRGTAVEDYTRRINPRLLTRANRYNATLQVENAVAYLLNGTIDAYLDDTPVLEYARTAMDVKCQLRLVGRGFGEDAYAIGLPKNSLLKESLTKKILEYHESGFTDDLKDLFFRRSKCNYHSNDGQLQGEFAPMNFDQHAGLYLLLLVGVFVCILLMFLEHATFKWMVPYWRRKPTVSFWKSPSMMFWSQRLHRIITSEQLVSPHHSAREMIEVVKNRDFAKLFQKSVRKQEKIARNRKNLFNVVEQLKWKNRPDEQSLQPGLRIDVSFESTVINFPPLHEGGERGERGEGGEKGEGGGGGILLQQMSAGSTAQTDDVASISSQKSASGPGCGGVSATNVVISTCCGGSSTPFRQSTSHTLTVAAAAAGLPGDAASASEEMESPSRGWRQKLLVRVKKPIECDSPETKSSQLDNDDDDAILKKNVVGHIGSSDWTPRDSQSSGGRVDLRSSPDLSRPTTARTRQLSTDDSPFDTMFLTTNEELPNGLVFLSPNGGLLKYVLPTTKIVPRRRRAASDVLAARPPHPPPPPPPPPPSSSSDVDVLTGKRRRETVERMVSLPVEGTVYDGRHRYSGGRTGGTSVRRGEEEEDDDEEEQLRRRRAMGAGLNGNDDPPQQPSSYVATSTADSGQGLPLNRAIGKRELNALTKEEVFLMWKASERELNVRLNDALRQKSEMQEKLASRTST